MNLEFPLSHAGVGLASFLAFVLGHALICRRNLKGDNYQFLIVLVLCIPLAIYLNIVLISGVSSPWTIPAVVHAILAANYIAIYPAFQASSPTIHILSYLWNEKRQVGELELMERFGKSGLVKDRVQDLEKGGLVKPSNEGTTLTLKGKVLARIFITYRQVLGLPLGAG